MFVNKQYLRIHVTHNIQTLLKQRHLLL